MKRILLFLSILALLPFGNLARGQTECSIFLTDNAEVTCIDEDEKDALLENDHQRLQACKGSVITYTAHIQLADGDTLATLSWSITGDVRHQANSATQSCYVEWGYTGVGIVIAEVTTTSGATCSAMVEVELIDPPIVGSTSAPNYVFANGVRTIHVCAGSDIYFTDESDPNGGTIVGYFWESLASHTTASTPNFVLENVTQNTVVVHRVYNNCGCFDEERYNIVIEPGRPLELSCFGTVCEGSTISYKALNVVCDKYNWYVEGGQIIDGQGTPSITVLWGSPSCGYGVLGLDGTQCEGEVCPSMMSVKVPVITSGVDITGDTIVCVRDIDHQEGHTYFVPLYGSTEYTWDIQGPGAVINPSHNPAEAVVFFDQPGDYILTTTYHCDFLGCGPFTSQKLVIHAKPRLRIDGSDKACVNHDARLTLSDRVTALWEVYELSSCNLVLTANDTAFHHTFTSAGRYRVTASHPDYCNTASFILTVYDPPAAPVIGDFLHPDTIYTCLNGYFQQKGKPSNELYGFVWESTCDEVTPGVIPGDSAIFACHGAICDINVYYVDRYTGCRSDSAYIQPVRPFVLAPINIPDPVRICPGTTISWTNANVPYQEGVLYLWEIEKYKQSYISIVGSQFENAVTLNVPLRQSSFLPPFYMVLTRTWCDSIRMDTVHFTFVPADTLTLTLTPDTAVICEGDTILFSLNTPPAGSHVSWDWDNGDVGRTNPIRYTYGEPGTYSVTSYCDYGYSYCDDRNYFQQNHAVVTVNPKPRVYGPYEDANNMMTVDPIPSNANYSYSWTFNGTPYGGNTRQIAYMGEGEYCCHVTTPEGCEDKFCVIQGLAQRPCENLELEHDIRKCDGYASVSVLHALSPIVWSVYGPHDVTPIESGTFNETAEFHFNHVGTYTIEAYTEIEGVCYSATVQVEICTILRIDAQPACDKIAVTNHSEFLSSGNVQCAVSQEGVPVPGSPFSFSITDQQVFIPVPIASGTYDLHFVYHTLCGDEICEKYLTVKFVDIPQGMRIKTDNTFNVHATCDNTPIRLWVEIPGVSNPSSLIQSVTWNYGDGAYDIRPGNSTTHTFEGGREYTVLATVLDVNNCTHAITIKISSEMNMTQGSILWDGIMKCPGSRVQLEYSYPFANIYDWHPQVESDPNNDYIGYVYYKGLYNIFVVNALYCQSQAQRYIPFANIPSASFCTLKPEYCQNDIVEVCAFCGVIGTGWSYNWTITDKYRNNVPFSSTNEEGSNIQFKATEDGTYTIELTVVGAPCSASCNKQINVLPSPATPVIGIDPHDACIGDPPVVLQTTASSPVGDVYWSNGTFGPTANYYAPGWASAYYVDNLTGCKSQEARIEIVPAPNFDGLLTGCYKKCASFFDYWLPAYALTDDHPVDCFWYWNGVLQQPPSTDYSCPTPQTRPIPLKLPLRGFGTYRLEVVYNNHCTAHSPELSIEPKEMCDCDSLALASYNVEYYLEGCNVFATVTMTIKNNGTRNACLSSANLSLPSDFATLSSSTLPTVIPPRGNGNITLYLRILDPTITHIPFQIYDSCNNCMSQLMVPIDINIEPCEKEGESTEMTVDPELTDQGALFFRFNFNIPPSATVVSVWSEPPQVVDFNTLNSPLEVLFMLDWGTYSQLVDLDTSICIYAIICDENRRFCKMKWCIKVDELREMADEYFPKGGMSPKTAEGNPVPDDSRPYLLPNPAQHSFTVMGVDKVTELTLIDMQGRKLATKDNSDTMDVQSIAKGAYIVRVVENGAKVHYLKLIKQ